MATGQSPFSSSWGYKYKSNNRIEFLRRTTKNPTNQPHPIITWLLAPLTVESASLTVNGASRNTETTVITLG